MISTTNIQIQDAILVHVPKPSRDFAKFAKNCRAVWFPYLKAWVFPAEEKEAICAMCANMRIAYKIEIEMQNLIDQRKD